MHSHILTDICIFVNSLLTYLLTYISIYPFQLVSLWSSWKGHK